MTWAPFMFALEAKALFEMGAVDDGNSDSVGSTCFCTAGAGAGATVPVNGGGSAACAGGTVDFGNAAGTATTSAGSWVWVSIDMQE